MPIAINGNVNGTQIWIPDHHWWDNRLFRVECGWRHLGLLR